MRRGLAAVLVGLGTLATSSVLASEVCYLTEGPGGIGSGSDCHNVEPVPADVHLRAQASEVSAEGQIGAFSIDKTGVGVSWGIPPQPRVWVDGQPTYIDIPPDPEDIPDPTEPPPPGSTCITNQVGPPDGTGQGTVCLDTPIISADLTNRPFEVNMSVAASSAVGGIGKTGVDIIYQFPFDDRLLQIWVDGSSCTLNPIINNYGCLQQ